MHAIKDFPHNQVALDAATGIEARGVAFVASSITLKGNAGTILHATKNVYEAPRGY